MRTAQSITPCGGSSTLPRKHDLFTMQHQMVNETSIRLTSGRVTALAYQKGALIAIPRRRHITPDRDVHQDEWSQYPSSLDAVQSHRECLFTALCGMGEIIYELSLSLFKHKHRKLDMKFAQLAEEMYLRLRKWHDELPDCLATIDATPHVLSLQFVFSARL